MFRFGPTNYSPSELAAQKVTTPKGFPCSYFRCHELIEAGDAGWMSSIVTESGEPGLYVIHRDCYLFSLGIINIDGTPRERQHEPGDPECHCDEWKHRPGS